MITLTHLYKHEKDTYHNDRDICNMRFDIGVSEPLSVDWLYKVIEEALKEAQKDKKEV